MASQDDSPSHHTSSSSPSSESSEPQHSTSPPQNPTPPRQGVTDHPATSTSATVTAVPLQSVAANATIDHRCFSGIVEVLPAPPAVTSKMSKADYSFPQYLMGLSAKIKRAGDRDITDPPSAKYIGMHLQSARYGFRVPTTPLMASICTLYRIAPGMLSPNSHRLIACLQSLCQFASIKVDLELFQVRKIGNKSLDYLNASQREGCRVVVGLNSSLKDWRNKFFFVRPTEGSFSFPTAWDESYYRLKKAPRPSSQTAVDCDIYLCLGSAKANNWSNLKALSKVELLPPGASLTGLPSHPSYHYIHRALLYPPDL